MSDPVYSSQALRLTEEEVLRLPHPPPVKVGSSTWHSLVGRQAAEEGGIPTRPLVRQQVRFKGSAAPAWPVIRFSLFHRRGASRRGCSACRQPPTQQPRYGRSTCCSGSYV
jgi:hypothetical protein